MDSSRQCPPTGLLQFACFRVLLLPYVKACCFVVTARKRQLNVAGTGSTPHAYTEPPHVGFKDHSLQPPRAWYGGSILAVDAIALSAGIAGIGAVVSDSSGVRDAGLPILIGAGLTYVLGGPIVHATHDRLGMTFASLGLRVGVPMGGCVSLGAGAGQRNSYAKLTRHRCGVSLSNELVIRAEISNCSSLPAKIPSRNPPSRTTWFWTDVVGASH